MQCPGACVQDFDAGGTGPAAQERSRAHRIDPAVRAVHQQPHPVGTDGLAVQSAPTAAIEGDDRAAGGAAAERVGPADGLVDGHLCGSAAGKGDEREPAQGPHVVYLHAMAACISDVQPPGPTIDGEGTGGERQLHGAEQHAFVGIDHAQSAADHLSRGGVGQHEYPAQRHIEREAETGWPRTEPASVRSEYL